MSKLQEEKLMIQLEIEGISTFYELGKITEAIKAYRKAFDDDRNWATLSLVEVIEVPDSPENYESTKGTELLYFGASPRSLDVGIFPYSVMKLENTLKSLVNVNLIKYDVVSMILNVWEVTSGERYSWFENEAFIVKVLVGRKYVPTWFKNEKYEEAIAHFMAHREAGAEVGLFLGKIKVNSVLAKGIEYFEMIKIAGDDVPDEVPLNTSDMYDGFRNDECDMVESIEILHEFQMIDDEQRKLFLRLQRHERPMVDSDDTPCIECVDSDENSELFHYQVEMVDEGVTYLSVVGTNADEDVFKNAVSDARYKLNGDMISNEEDGCILDYLKRQLEGYGYTFASTELKEIKGTYTI